mgnify:CR=1 FL=1|jgi:hypothetical protein
MGVPWLLDFVAACDGCTIDAYAVSLVRCKLLTASKTADLSSIRKLHWYDAAGSVRRTRHLRSQPVLSKPTHRILTGELLTHSNTDYFTSYLTDAHAKLKKPIWLTEFMGRGTLEEQKKFLQFAVPWLEKQDFIERYAVFGECMEQLKREMTRCRV